MKIQFTPVFRMWKEKFKPKYYYKMVHWIHFMTLMINDVPGHEKGMEIHLALFNFGLRIDVWWKKK